MSFLMQNEGTSPLEREIITWYWCRPTEYKGDREEWTELEHKIVVALIERGMLKVKGVATNRNGWSYQTIEAVRDAVEPYMKALAAVPLPVQQWVIP